MEEEGGSGGGREEEVSLGYYVTSGEKSPLWRILRNFRLSMRTPKETPFEVTRLPLALLVMRNDIFCTTTIVVVVQNIPVAHAHVITSGSGHVTSGHVTDVTSGHVTSGHVTSGPAQWSDPHPSPTNV